MSISKDWLDKAYEGKSAKELISSPVDALQGVSAGDAELLQKAFNIKTIKDLATSKYVIWAQEIVAGKAGDIKNKVDKAFETKTQSEIADSPVDALQGVSSGDAEKLKKAFNIKTVKDFANLKFVKWAQEIVAQA